MKTEGLLKAIKNNDIYAYHGNDKYTNLSRGGGGKIALSDAQRLFNIPITLNLFVERNPLVLDLIVAGNFSLEDYTDSEKKEFEKNFEKSLVE